MNNNFNNKKGIGPVVATALLLVVAVVAVIGFQGWFTGYQSTLNTQVESQGGQTMNTGIETMIGNTIFIKNNYDNLSILSVKVDGVDCNLTTSIISGMRPLNISGCIDYDNMTTDTPEIVVVTDKGIMSKYVYVKDAQVTYVPPPSQSTYLDCNVDGFEVTHSNSVTAYFSDSVTYGNNCESETRTCNDGNLSGSYTFSSCEVLPLDCGALSLAGGEWITVPGSSTLGTNDFCVMKYEAKAYDNSSLSYIADGGNTLSNNWANLDIIEAHSVATARPWVRVTWNKAKEACLNLGNGYKLVNDNEWLTIANNVVNQNNNWNTSIVGDGSLFRGNSNSGASMDGTDALTGINTRTLTLSNGEVIWDLAGNVYQWVDTIIASVDRYHGGDQQWMSYHSEDGIGDKIATNVPSLMSPPNNWNANQGMGRYYDGYSLDGAYNNVYEGPESECLESQIPGYCSPTAVFLRGGYWYHGAYAGAFALRLDNGPSFSGTGGGFRCSFEP